MINIKSKKNKSANGETTYFDYSLLFIIIFLIGFGMVMLYSTSSYNAQLKFDDPLHYVKTQGMATVFGFVVIAVLIKAIDYHLYGKFAVFAYFAGLVLVILVKTGLGMEFNGARRWLKLGPLSFQPAEAVKLIVIISMAYMINEMGAKVNTLKGMFFLFGMTTLQAGFLGVITSNLSSAIIVEGIGVIMIFVATKNYKPFIILGLIGVSAVALFFLYETKIASSFRLERVKVWLDPTNEKYINDGGYQVLQALYAIGSGGILGKGLGNSIQKMGFVPEAQNDMIFTIICEELGLVGGIGLIAMFAFMIWRFMVIANNAPDLFGAMIVVGVLAHIALQVVLNVAVVTNTIPNTGVTLPFISYGGTSVLFLMTEMGIVLSISRRIRHEE